VSADDREPPDGRTRGLKLDYHQPEPRRFYWSVGTGCLIMAAVVVVLIGVVLGTCALMR
jgi:hypothetical protein